MSDVIETVITPRDRDLGEFSVRRVLPYAKRRMVGPFIFFDHIGPAVFEPDSGIAVRPHPHIGLATVTYLFDGEIRHRDSTGALQDIRPGDVNWMNAGRGIVHSERSRPEIWQSGGPLHGIQSWLALPLDREDSAPFFEHHPAASLPELRLDGVTLRVIAGESFGQKAPATVYWPTLYCDLSIEAGGTLILPPEHEERAVYVASGAVTLDGAAIGEAQMAVLRPGDAVTLTATQASRVMLAGGAPIDGERHIWWNLVASSQARLDAGKAEWLRYAEGSDRFPKVPGDEAEFIPLPEE